MSAGGLSEVKPATPEIQEMVDQTKGEIEKKENKTYSIFKAIEYRTQLVSGTNYFIKVDGGKEYLHVRIYKPLPQSGEKPSLTSYQTGKTASDPLIYF
ncbi:cystatin-A [Anolis carolinensis]|uniref:Cystatin domain-containing protein n=1 Tax=Anolis carolinensis TaxID=28377 RepID=G1KRD1_ANOCA|nr:PREDICTED: cystatin-A [Anolis carolinensis]|eukprot:XP_008101925.1 PREDICTED: cystatin-A [Anolis carolinensis]